MKKIIYQCDISTCSNQVSEDEADLCYSVVKIPSKDEIDWGIEPKLDLERLDVCDDCQNKMIASRSMITQQELGQDGIIYYTI